MAQGYSLHFGLNDIDKASYKGNYQVLRNAENDTDYYYNLAKSRNFNATKFLGKDATSNNLLTNLKELALKMLSGDMLFLSYSGHGSRVKDLNKDEEDGYDEVLVLYDRLFIDDEFQQCWARFKQGVRIFFINDSCYNGTVTKMMLRHSAVADQIWPEHVLRGIDTRETNIDFQQKVDFYKGLKTENDTAKVLCSIIHVGACQDNQLADDGAIVDKNGKFTLAVRKILSAGNFTGSYKSLYELVKKEMPPWQTPNWDIEAGKKDEEFEKTSFLKI